MSFDLPLLIIIGFLLSTTAIVFYSIKNFTTFRVYAVGNRQFSTASLVATSLATYYGGATFITNIAPLSYSYLNPFWLSWRLLDILIPFLMLSWLSIRMSKFIYHISMPETIGRVYGKYPRVITALLSCCHSIMFIATQVHILSQVIPECIHSVNPIHVTILATILLVAYTMLGGSRTVVLTDVWQLITFISLLFLLTWFMFTKTGRPISEIFTFVATKKAFTWSRLFCSEHKFVLILRYLSLIFAFIEPCYMQHVYMATQPAQAKKVCIYAGIVGFVIMLACILLSFIVFAWLSPHVPLKETLHYLLTHSAPWFKGLLCICLLALTMSTADSRLHICAVMISYDIAPMLLGERIKRQLSCMDYYRIAYISILVIAVLGIVLSLTSPILLALRTVHHSLHRFYVPMVAAPFILAILGFQTTSRNALIGMATGALSVVAWKKWIYPLLLTNSSTFPCVLVNGLTMLAAHYLWPQSRSTKKLKDDGMQNK